VVALSVRFEEVAGFYDPFFYRNSTQEISVGRRIFRWPQLDLMIWKIPPSPLRVLQNGNRLTGKFQHENGPVLSLSMQMNENTDFGQVVPVSVTFYTMRVLPDPVSLYSRLEIFHSHMSDMSISYAKFCRGVLMESAA